MPRLTPRDLVAIILSISILAHPLGMVWLRYMLDKPLLEPAASMTEAIIVATLAVVAGYLAGPDRRPPNGRNGT